MAEPIAARRLGVYYTPAQLAHALTRWALQTNVTSVLDPSCGDGRFVRAAASELAGTEGARILGIDINHSAVQALSRERLHGVRVDVRSFFDIAAPDCLDAPFGAVIGNPPYVRHHWQEPDVLERARARATEAGVTLSGLADLWAYFVVHATQHVALDGRLALVLPVAATQAHYTYDIWDFLKCNFGRVELLILQDRTFEETREQSVMLLASNRGGCTRTLRTEVVPTIAELLARLDASPTEVDRESDAPMGVVLWKWNMLPLETRQLWGELCATPEVRTLGRCADVRIGTVTGANGIFVRRASDPILEEPVVEARPVISSSRLLTRAVWSADDDRASGELRGGGRLMVIDPTCEPTGRLRAVLDDAEADGIHKRRHCSRRDPWWGLRDVDAPDAFLGYMGTYPHGLVCNASGALCTNAVHRISWKHGSCLLGAAVASWSSLFHISAELYGRHYGGGILKLEPSAAKLLPVVLSGKLANALTDIDAFLRRSQDHAARRLADQRVVAALGASPSDLRRLAEAAEMLASARRMPR